MGFIYLHGGFLEIQGTLCIPCGNVYYIREMEHIYHIAELVIMHWILSTYDYSSGHG